MSVTFKTTAKIRLTPAQWQLYSYSMDCQPAADQLNAAMEYAISSSESANEAWKLVYPIMVEWKDHGALDSEPIWVARDILARAFRDEEEDHDD